MDTKIIKAMKCREISDGYASDEIEEIEEITMFLFDGDMNKEIAAEALSRMNDIAEYDDDDAKGFAEAVEELAETEEVSYKGYEYYVDDVVMYVTEKK